jgi:hypothetical protein
MDIQVVSLADFDFWRAILPFPSAKPHDSSLAAPAAITPATGEKLYQPGQLWGKTLQLL